MVDNRTLVSNRAPMVPRLTQKQAIEIVRKIQREEPVDPRTELLPLLTFARNNAKLDLEALAAEQNAPED
ncbi:MAG: hypothetical protein COV44_10655 [Deltaproteobacteria bacterium CG11_big_fil_rev_8_21_14_0_20_45_16]|uniref:Uncharacterized protein n=2 Tax=Katanobacteria TaxID=422282 RepID=A0A2M7X013_UNCKA|nr:MAG: hypothetical protein COX05_04930 [candidate division WWE3 bacterium CG22_combo_CG10-13_8_21_14_all_39_12]PIR21942.1 MAG: hypothetical protein COV44_10655 [Deltaproteobacteria bacterium CG11_big_fil_rev_8_21_14_0_20_45_16]PJA39327.1 MAG: hypothetical protein CO179_05495 [candidate division WWE3 bacterium CG_4_9_14_3_um_filter_39_7]